MEKVRNSSIMRQESYEISARGEERAVDFYRFFYGDLDAQADSDAEVREDEPTAAEQSAFLKTALLLFAGAVGTVLAVLLV